MDILVPNFPHLFGKRDVLDEAKRRAPPFPLPGDRGKVNDGTHARPVFPGDVVQCDEVYLESLFNRLDDMRLQLLRFGCAAPPLVQTPDAETRDHLFQVLSEVQQLTPELERLVAHPELCADVRRLHKFFCQTAKVVNLARVIQYLVKRMRLAEDEGTETFWQLKSRRPTDAQGDEVPAWLTWCQQRGPLLPTSFPNFEKFVTEKDLYRVATQTLPLQGVLIAEHWRNYVCKLVQSIVAKCPDHAEAEAQYPHESSMLNGEMAQPGFVCARQQYPHRIEMYAEFRKALAMGARDPVAASARLMAILDGDVTSGSGSAVAQGMFVENSETSKILDLLNERKK